MTNPKPDSNVFDSTAVFEYVAGQMSDASIKQFEARLQSDSQLQQEVALERDLRTSMNCPGSSSDAALLSDNNFDRLLQRIDDSENLSTDELPANVISLNKSKFKPVGIAASLVVASVITLNLWSSLNDPKFITLSSTEQPLNFGQLVEQQRVLILFLSQTGITDHESLLEQFELEAIDINPANGKLIVKTQEPLTVEQLQLLRDSSEIESAKIFKFDEN